LNTTKLENVYQWVTQNIEEEYVLDYLYNKRLYPASLPAVPEDLGIEQAAARELIRGAIAKSDSSFPRNIARPAQFNTLPWFSHILVSGGVISHAATPAQSMLTVLDAVQPTGVSRLILDKNALASALGAAAVVNSILAVHVLESNTFLPLGYTICPVGRARMGTPVLQLRIRYDTGQETTYEVKYGTIRTIPLPIGRLAQVQLQPLQRMDVGWGPGKGDWFPKKIMGGIFGLVVDARGRPLEVPRKLEERRNLLKKWYLSLQR
jgi:hypothetical protein